jgi:hypothetical protein
MMRRHLWLTVVGNLVLLGTLVVPLKAAAPTQSVRLTGITLSACNELEVGYVTVQGTLRTLGSKPPFVCDTVSIRDKKIRVEVPDGSQLWLRDLSCGTIYYSDGTGDANHAGITNLDGALQIDIADAGGGCGISGTESIPGPGLGNLTLIYSPQ